MRSTSRVSVVSLRREGPKATVSENIIASATERSQEKNWSSPLPVVVELLAKYIKKQEQWRHKGQVLRLVNKSWSSYVDVLTQDLSVRLSPHVGIAALEKSLGKFPYVQTLVLSHDRPMSSCYGRKLSIASNFNQLKSLEIQNLSLKGKAIRILCLKTSLTTLVLRSTNLDQKSLMRLSRLSNLTYLSLQKVEGLSRTEEFEFLDHLSKLNSLKIQETNLLRKKSVMSHVGRIQSLRILSLDRPETLQDHEVILLSTLTNLTSLRLFCKDIKTPKSLDFLSGFHSLKKLELLEVESRLLEGWIDSSSQLESLTLSCARMGDSFNLPGNIEAIIPNLTSLTLYDFTVPSPQLESLIKLGTSLSDLSLGSLTLESRLSFSSLRKLTSFCCNYNRHLESEFLLEMSQVQTLRELTVGHLKGFVIDHLFTLVSQSLTSLTSLGLLDLMFNGDRILALSKATSLRHLTIVQCPSLSDIHFTCLQSLASLRALKCLNVACEMNITFWKSFLKLEFLTQLDQLGMKIGDELEASYLSQFANKAPTVKIQTSSNWEKSLFNHNLEVFKR